MELVRWLGEVELTFNPFFYPSHAHGTYGGKTPTIAQSGWATVFCKGRGPGYCSATSTLSPSHAQSEEANSLARRLPSRMRSVATFKRRVKLFNLQGEDIGEIYGTGGSVK